MSYRQKEINVSNDPCLFGKPVVTGQRLVQKQNCKENPNRGRQAEMGPINSIYFCWRSFEGFARTWDAGEQGRSWAHLSLLALHVEGEETGTEVVWTARRHRADVFLQMIKHLLGLRHSSYMNCNPCSKPLHDKQENQVESFIVIELTKGRTWSDSHTQAWGFVTAFIFQVCPRGRKVGLVWASSKVLGVLS